MFLLIGEFGFLSGYLYFTGVSDGLDDGRGGGTTNGEENDLEEASLSSNVSTEDDETSSLKWLTTFFELLLFKWSKISSS